MRYQRRNILRALTAFILSLSLLIAGSSAAFASFGGGLGGNPSPGGGSGGSGSGGSGSSGGGSNGGSTVPPSPTWTDWVYNSAYVFSPPTTCGTDANGQAAVGYFYSYETRWLRGEVGQSTRSETRNYTWRCLFPPGWSDSSVVCIRQTNVNIAMTAPSSVALGSKSLRSGYASSPSIATCNASRQYLDLYVDPTALGRYEFSGTQQRDRCAIRTFTAGYRNGSLVTPAPELVNCAAIGNLSVSSVGELSCRGWTDGRTGRTDWTSTECSNQASTHYTYQCVIGQTKQNGVAGTSQQILGRGVNTDGRGSVLAYTSVGVTGSAVSTLGSPSTRVSLSGTPANASSDRSKWLVDVQDYNRKVSLLNSTGKATNWNSGIATAFSLPVYQASDPKSPLLVDTSWRWTGSKVKQQSVVITGIDPMTFRLRTETITVPVTQTLVCNAPQTSWSVARGSLDVAR